MSEAHPESPCVSVCALDPSGGYCVGCWRSTSEIAEWSSMSASDKHAVLALTEQRKAVRRAEMRELRRQRAAARRRG